MEVGLVLSVILIVHVLLCSLLTDRTLTNQDPWYISNVLGCFWVILLFLFYVVCCFGRLCLPHLECFILGNHCKYLGSGPVMKRIWYICSWYTLYSIYVCMHYILHMYAIILCIVVYICILYTVITYNIQLTTSYTHLANSSLYEYFCP